MDCPFCGCNQVMVINSRPNVLKNQIWRRRKCLRCGQTFTTYEKINLSYLVVIKKSGKKQKYNRAKLYAAIYHAGLDEKRVDRGDVSAFAEILTEAVEKCIFKLKKKQITTSEIKEMVLKNLRSKAPATFLRYLAYREGGDKRELKKVVRKYF